MTIFQQPSNASGSISFYELSALVISGCALGQTIKKLNFLHTDEAQHDYLLYDRQLCSEVQISELKITVYPKSIISLQHLFPSPVSIKFSIDNMNAKTPQE